MKLCFLVCGNGYGHLKRVCDVVKNMLSKNQQISILIIGASHHEAWVNDWLSSKQFPPNKTIFINGFTEKNLTADINELYTVTDYNESFQRIIKLITEFGPDKIISDNLVGILDTFPESILMGSFLWSDVLNDHALSLDCKKICEFEDSLLKKIKPVMLGVKDIAMPAIKFKTDFVGLPWFCEKKFTTRGSERNKNSNKLNILATGGGTGILSEELVEIIEALNRNKKFNLFLDGKLFQMVKFKDHFSLFSFTDQGFETIHWIVCRPGVGILTDAVKFNIPVYAVSGSNQEMIHNSKRVEELGMGLRHETGGNDLNSALTSDTKVFCRSINNLHTGGDVLAADYILT